MKTNFPGLNISSSGFNKFNSQCKTNKTFFQLYSKHVIFKRDFHVKTNNISRLKSDLRIGPHNLDVISVLVGSILGDSHLEKRKMGLGTRVIFEQCNRNVEYIMWFHEFFSSRGYSSTDKPKLITRIKKHNKVFYQYRVSSYTFTSLN
jgi:ubiquinol-cytochrome c reductase cytochrome b subunit